MNTSWPGKLPALPIWEEVLFASSGLSAESCAHPERAWHDSVPLCGDGTLAVRSHPVTCEGRCMLYIIREIFYAQC